MSWFDQFIMARNGFTAMLSQPLPKYVRKIEVSVEGGVKGSGKMRLGNMVDPKYTLGASISKKIVEAHRS